MAQFVAIPSATSNEVHYINLDAVCYVRQHINPEHCSVHFGNEHKLLLSVPASTILDQIGR